jgi:shikimate dehydrogenase
MESAKDAQVPTVIDGWGMLIEQAAESFNLWTNVNPDTSNLIAKHGE